MSISEFLNLSFSDIDENKKLDKNTKIALTILKIAEYNEKIYIEPIYFITSANIFAYQNEIIDFDLYAIVKFIATIKKIYKYKIYSDAVKNFIVFSLWVNNIYILPKMFNFCKNNYLAFYKHLIFNDDIEKLKLLEKINLEYRKKLKNKEDNFLNGSFNAFNLKITKGIDDYFLKIQKEDDILNIIQKL